MNNSENSGRNFLKKSVIGTAMLATQNILNANAMNLHSDELRNNSRWYKYWKETQTEGVIVNAGGIVAYYPTQIPLHRKAEFLGNRDLFGEFCHAAHEERIAVLARMDSNRAHKEFFTAHPDWFSVDAKGDPYRAADLYISCINSHITKTTFRLY